MLRNINKLLLVSAIALILAIPINASALATTTNNSVKAEALLAQAEVAVDSLLVEKKNNPGNYEVVDLKVPKALLQGEYGIADNKSERDFVKQRLQEKLADPTVLNAQPNYIYKLSWSGDSTKATPNDWSANHWYYEAGKVREMWKFQGCDTGGAGCGGSNAVMVAIIDTGLAFENFTGMVVTSDIPPAAPVWEQATFLAASEYSALSFYQNPGETPGNELDDDCNGYVDDYNGADTYAAIKGGTNTCLAGSPVVPGTNQIKAGHPVDNYGHGSLVAGTIASATDNSAGSVSPGFKLRLLPISANIHFTRNFNSASLVEAVRYARSAGADVINMSFGSSAIDTALQNQLNAAYSEGIVLVASSGNDGETATPTAPIYPAAYANVISVGSVNSDGSRSNYSSYGSTLDVVAYVGQGGVNGSIWQTTNACYSTCNKNNIDDNPATQKNAIGTSFASPQVAALAGLILANYPSLTPEGVYQRIIQTAVNLGPISWDQETGWGAVNFYRATAETDLEPLVVTVHRFLHKQLKVHFYTASESEKAFVQTQLASIWEYEGVGYYAYDRAHTSTTPVYRFLHKGLKIHFYTANESEKNFVINSLSGTWQYEGVGYYASSTSAGHSPVYRFLQKNFKVHFYTANESEKTFVQTQLAAIWEFEGIGFHVR